MADWKNSRAEAEMLRAEAEMIKKLNREDNSIKQPSENSTDRLLSMLPGIVTDLESTASSIDVKLEYLDFLNKNFSLVRNYKDIGKYEF